MPAHSSVIPEVLAAPTSIGALLAAYRDGSLTPGKLIGDLLTRIDSAARDEVWISRVPAKQLRQQAAALDLMLQIKGAAVFDSMPLFGVPFAVKDNIDVADMATTAGCPEYARVAASNATVVTRLQQAGALLVGKTNLDQFATGLVGVRSPYGAVRNTFKPEYVSGGSSSGSAVAVGLGQVLFSLGTDTAGSGRVPAAFNNLVGLKPSRGLISNHGLVPACRTLDCISIFAHDVGSAWQVLRSAAGFDAADPYSRALPMAGVKRRGYRVAVPQQPEFYGDVIAQEAYERTLAQITALPGVTVTGIAFDVFTDAAQMLYQGPWVGERRAVLGDFFIEHNQAVHPVVRQITAQAENYDAVDAFNAQYHLAELRREAETLLADSDLLLVPTTTTFPTIAEVEADPIVRNSQLGYYTNFVNLMDMAALAIPGLWRRDGLPAGVTLIGPAGSDQMLAEAGARFQQALGGASQADAIATAPLPASEASIAVCVVGAHLSGQPLNWQLLEAGAHRVAVTTTAPRYRLYALPGTTPPKPGLARTATEGAAIAVEVWQMPLRQFGGFVAAIAAPLGIGTVELADGSAVKGFICEPAGLDGATDITHHGAWVTYLASLA
ncbi:allophanate hydrolase [Herbaspirillum sp. alder98]|uniref:allophanate hydrolase n=1 Tax=Herbaspirillum sp. alder98 TaxID=2913096 RepID=UPI001CD89602|nr:allophanate hydrolase [Herbaspirillum sp. alder98]MCA1323288.1 allophanate hydrolase [Herbaspirillum sp. alder98]